MCSSTTTASPAPPDAPALPALSASPALPAPPAPSIHQFPDERHGPAQATTLPPANPRRSVVTRTGRPPATATRAGTGWRHRRNAELAEFAEPAESAEPAEPAELF